MGRAVRRIAVKELDTWWMRWERWKRACERPPWLAGLHKRPWRDGFSTTEWDVGHLSIGRAEDVAALLAEEEV